MSRVSLCLTVLNEAGSIDELMRSVVSQTRLPDEVVVVDGGSTDGTLEKLELYRNRLNVRIFKEPGASISKGRNEAIRNAGGEIIAVTDAGVRLSPNWLAGLAAPIEAGTADVSAGFFRTDPRSLFETAMGATVLPFQRDINPESFLPSSRSIAFRKEVWSSVGGYPEWLDYCEDLIFDLAYLSRYFRQAWVPEAIAHFRPRSSLKSFWLQYFRYARGDGKADLWRKRHAARYLTYLVGAPAGLLLTKRVPYFAALILMAGLLYIKTPAARFLNLSANLGVGKRSLGLALVPMIRLTGDLAKMAGYPVGVLWRLKREHEGWVRPG